MKVGLLKGDSALNLNQNQRFESKQHMARLLTISNRYFHQCRLGGALISALAALVATSPSAAADRIALVIGNGGYQHLQPLDHVGGDTLVVADTLRGLDFDVDALTDLDRQTMQTRLDDFGRRIDQAGEDTVGLLFYAGHGFQRAGSNYLLPVDADMVGLEDIEEAAISLDLTLAEIAFATNDHKLVILDVPMDEAIGREWGDQPGLAVVDAPVGTLVAYGALPGIADEKPPYEGLYPLALANVLAKPGLKVEQAFQEVRLNVAEATDGVQIPWESSSLVSPLYLAGPPEPIDRSREVHLDETGVTPVPLIDARTVDLVFWTSIKNSRDPDDFTDYLQAFPEGVFKNLAERRLKRLGEEDDGIVMQASPDHDIEPLDDQLITQKRSNIRAEPSSIGVIVATIEPNQMMSVTGKVIDSDWLRVRLTTEVEAFIWAPLLGRSPPSDSVDGLAATLPPSKTALFGLWQGEYQCQWDTIGFTLDVTDEEHRDTDGISAVFSFFPLPGSSLVPPGSYAMAGDYDAEDGTIILKGGDWIDRPHGLQRHDLAGRAEIGGTAIHGRIETPGCSDFYLVRDDGRGLPTAQSTSTQ